MPTDRTDESDTAEDVLQEVHFVDSIANLLVHVVALGIHEAGTFHLAEELIEVTNTVRQGFKLTIVIGYADLIEKQRGLRFGTEQLQVLVLDHANIRDIYIRHIGIDRPSPTLVFKHLLSEEQRLPRSLLAKDIVELIGVFILDRQHDKDRDENNEHNKKSSHKKSSAHPKVGTRTEGAAYSPIIRRIRPTPRPTIETMTNTRRSGFDTMQVTKSPIQVIAAVTKLPILSRIVARVLPVGVVVGLSPFHLRFIIERNTAMITMSSQRATK